MAFNTLDSIVLKTAEGQMLQNEKDFKYLGSWINSSEMALVEALDLHALHSMHCTLYDSLR